MNKLLEIKDLVTNFYTYEGVIKAINHVSLEIEKDITFGLVGESGCGKSVTARSIMRIIQPPGKIEGGEILFYHDNSDSNKSVDILKQDDRYMQTLRGSLISMIFQEPNLALNPVLSIGYQVAESFHFHQKMEMSQAILHQLKAKDCNTVQPLRAFYTWCYAKSVKSEKSFLLGLISKIPILKSWKRLLDKEARKRSLDILQKLGIANVELIYDSYPHNLSGGMKQRIVIALALACRPILLIADEATSNLDVTVQAQILDLLIELKKDSISSILLITHDLGVVAETCDRAGVMYAGNVCEVADVKDLFDNPKHPYTKALLNSVPKFTQQGSLQAIPGSVPDLVTPPSGCRFHPRCPSCFDQCKNETPELQSIGRRHQVACHLYTNFS
jgi:peptide/nickel transport system ATP-binding protein